MASSLWQRSESLVTTHEHGGSLWLKFPNDGDKAVVVFLGDPYPREICFVDGKYVLYNEQLKAQGHKLTVRVAINAALYATKEVKVLEMSAMLFKDLVRIRGKYGLEGRAFEVQRHGAAKDPKTTYSILPEHQLTPEQQRVFSSLTLHKLAKLYGDEPEGGGHAASAAQSEVYTPQPATLIDTTRAQTLATQLKELPREAVERFLRQFGIQRVKELSAARFAEAMTLVKNLMAEFAPPELPDEVDPFSDLPDDAL